MSTDERCEHGQLGPCALCAVADEIVRLTQEVAALRQLIESYSSDQCTCGGACGAGDEDACAWCRLYHAAKEVK